MALCDSALPKQVRGRYEQFQDSKHSDYAAFRWKVDNQTVHILIRSLKSNDVHVDWYFLTSRGATIVTGWSSDDPAIYWN